MIHIRSGGTCPQCKMPVRLSGDNRMSEHKSDRISIGSKGERTKETCRYGGGMWADAKADITPLCRKTIERLRALGVLREHESEYINRRGGFQ